ncbi:MAG: phosphatase PAP2 family protein [Sphingomonadaceae bacterium]|nr:phosphatase PAP2 family protein [Sphingomonadaceae bacterium]
MSGPETVTGSLRRSPFIRREGRLILSFVAVAIALFLVALLGSEIAEGETSAFDRWALLALRRPDDLAAPIGPAWLKPAMVDITALGGVTALTLLTLLVIGFLLTKRSYTAAILIACATISGTLVGQVLKHAFGRQRPTIVPRLVEIHTLSYPSGHALNSAVIYLTLGAILARTEAQLRTRVYVLTASMTVALLIGISRVYAGVHWPTDVLAGWAVGAGWALLWWAISFKFRPKRDA